MSISVKLRSTSGAYERLSTTHLSMSSRMESIEDRSGGRPVSSPRKLSPGETELKTISLLLVETVWYIFKAIVHKGSCAFLDMCLRREVKWSEAKALRRMRRMPVKAAFRLCVSRSLEVMRWTKFRRVGRVPRMLETHSSKGACNCPHV